MGEVRYLPLAYEAQPGNTGMGGLRHRPLHVEMKDRLRLASAVLSQPPPAGIARARRAVAVQAVTDKIDVDVFLARSVTMVRGLLRIS